MIDVDLPEADGVPELVRSFAAGVASVTETPIAEVPLPRADLHGGPRTLAKLARGPGCGTGGHRETGRLQLAGILAGRADTDLRVREGWVLSGLDPASITAPQVPTARAPRHDRGDRARRPATGDLHVVELARAFANPGLDGDPYAAQDWHLHPGQRHRARLRPHPDRGGSPRRITLPDGARIETID